MTLQDRAQAVQAYGFTTRQAAFLTTVMLHSGVCLPRHYTRFCGIVFGHTTRDFFARLTARRFATAHACWRRGGTLYHVHHKALYRAIGEPDNRHRRRLTIPRAVERLMLLDVVIESPDMVWLATEREKVNSFLHAMPSCVLDASDLPSLSFGEGDRRTVRYFTDKLPIGLGPGREEVVFVYLATQPRPERFRHFLSSHRRLFQRLRGWTLRLVFPRFLASSQRQYERAAATLFAPPIPLSLVEEFRWYCQHRRRLEQGSLRPPDAEQGRYANARLAFAAPRFGDAYREWRTEGDASLHALLSPHLHEAWRRGDVRLQTHVLPYRYLNLAPSVDTA